MLTLCGFSASNYYNKVKLALLEKGVPFEEREVWTGQPPTDASPLAKVPFLLTPQGAISESTPILEYVEAQYPQHPLLPADPFEAAKVRELVRYLELHLELVARRLYPQAFFGGQISEETKKQAGRDLEKGTAALARLTPFTAPYIAGDTFTLADCAAVVHLPLVASASKLVLGQDVLANQPVKEYLARIGERPHVQRINADRKASVQAMMARK